MRSRCARAPPCCKLRTKRHARRNSCVRALSAGTLGAHARYLGAAARSDLGCYADKPLLRDLTVAAVPLESRQGLAVAACELEGTLFAGLQRQPKQTWCWCGDMPMQYGESSQFGLTAHGPFQTGLRGPRPSGWCVVDRAGEHVRRCARGFSCTDVFTASTRSYSSRHGVDLLLQQRRLDARLPAPFSKLVMIWRLLRIRVHTWIWPLWGIWGCRLCRYVPPLRVALEHGGGPPLR